ncbi:MAG: CHASE2 domain-containing protein, partial [Phycisphaerae bacterium]|nr:CHASE2 domain-containing protein [Phycisphaerae bacterium]
MTAPEQAQLRQTLLVALTLTLLVVMAENVGWLVDLENALYDQRARVFRVFTPPPTEQLIHLDIDDRSLEVIGRWPWPRSYLAEILDELGEAGSRAVAFDVIFSEPQGVRIESRPDGKPGTSVDDDARFAEAIRRHGKVLIPLDLTLEAAGRASAAFDAMYEVLLSNLEAPPVEVFRAARDQGVRVDRLEADDVFLRARRQAMHDAIERELEEGAQAFEVLERRLLPTQDPRLDSPLRRLLREQYGRLMARRVLDRFTRPTDEDLPPMIPGQGDLPPILALGSVAASTGFVASVRSEDGVMRAMPLLAEYRGRLYPQLSLALACLMLGVETTDIQIGKDQLIIPHPGGDPIVVPVRGQYDRASRRRFALYMDVPWFGPAGNWLVMYDHGRYREPTQHLPIVVVWDAIQKKKRIAQNNLIADEAILFLYSKTDPSQAAAYKSKRPPIDRATAREPFIRAVLGDPFIAGMVEQLRSEDPSSRDEEVQQILAAYDDLKLVLEANRNLVAEEKQQRQFLQETLRGKAVLVGSTATAAGQTDLVPTSLHARAPGPVVHGVIFSGLMTGDLWESAPRGLAPVLTAASGALVTVVVVWLPPLVSTLALAVIALGYVIVNGLVLFDYGNVIVPAAGPLTAMVVVWMGGTVWRYFVERAERARVTGRFRSYVDPALVDYVMEHPEQATLEGEIRELTVVFTDLAGFTSISEKLGAKVVPLLNEYMSLMVPVIRRHGGYVNKFLGDGIMFFFGAPRSSATHASDAVGTALEIQEVMRSFNEQLGGRGLPTVMTRLGMCTGEMVVGDMGPADASDYTVLGDV